MPKPTLYLRFIHGRKTVDGDDERIMSEIIEISGKYMSLVSDMSGHVKLEDNYGNSYFISPIGNTGVMLYDGMFYTDINIFCEKPEYWQGALVPFADVAHKFENAHAETKRWLQFVKDEREAADMLYQLLNFVHDDQGMCTKHTGLTASFGKALSTIASWRAAATTLKERLS